MNKKLDRFYKALLNGFHGITPSKRYEYWMQVIIVRGFAHTHDTKVKGKTFDIYGYQFEYVDITMEDVKTITGFCIAYLFIEAIKEYETIYKKTFIIDNNLFVNSVMTLSKSGIIDIDKSGGLSSDINNYIPRNRLMKSVEMFSTLFDIS